jgi:hypothetical protein
MIKKTVLMHTYEVCKSFHVLKGFSDPRGGQLHTIHSYCNCRDANMISSSRFTGHYSDYAQYKLLSGSSDSNMVGMLGRTHNV